MDIKLTLSLIDRLGLEIPVIQGPFGGGLSTIELTSTVSNLGGLGSFGAYHIDGTGIERLIGNLRSQTERPFAINLWVKDHDLGGDDMSQEVFEASWKHYEPYFREFGLDKPEKPASYHVRFDEQVEALIASQPAVFSFVFGIPSQAILKACQKADILTIGAATSLAEIDALSETDVDVILVTGFEAGGHRPSFLERPEDSLMGTLALTTLSVRRTRKPIVAAGGLVASTGIQAVLTAGAQAAQLGTAFLACAESGATQRHRDILFSKQSEKTVLTRAYSGRLARGIPNRLISEFDKRSSSLPPFPIHGWFVGKLRAAAIAANISDFVSLYAGQGAPLIKHKTATELMVSLRSDLII